MIKGKNGYQVLFPFTLENFEAKYSYNASSVTYPSKHPRYRTSTGRNCFGILKNFKLKPLKDVELNNELWTRKNL